MRTFGDALVAWICDLVTGATGGMINVDGWREELYRTEMEVAELRRRADWLEEKVNPAPRPFEAYTDCPKCGRMDYHRMREPRPYSRREVEAELAQATRAVEEAEDRGESGDRLIVLGQRRQRFVELLTDHFGECRFETIRICTGCGHEWGML